MEHLLFSNRMMDSTLDADNEQYMEDIDEHFYDGLSPLERLVQSVDSVNIFYRQRAARNIVETVSETVHDEETFNKVMKCMAILSSGAEPGIKNELIDRLPHVAELCAASGQQYAEDAVGDFFVPMVLGYLINMDNQVRKTCHAAVLQMLESPYTISDKILEDHICAKLIELTAVDMTDDFRIEAVTLMCRIAHIVGREMAERVFLQRFSDLCTDSLFYVRKVCATNFGEMCRIFGPEATDDLLIKFSILCKDGIWGVRKACAECFMQVACTCSPIVRRYHLAPIFDTLICDQSRWVRVAAFQSLGPFISTFADPSKTHMCLSEDGSIVHLADDVMTPTSPCSPASEVQYNDSRTDIEDVPVEAAFATLYYWKEPLAVLDVDLLPTAVLPEVPPVATIPIEVDDPVEEDSCTCPDSSSFREMFLQSLNLTCMGDSVFGESDASSLRNYGDLFIETDDCQAGDLSKTDNSHPTADCSADKDWIQSELTTGCSDKDWKQSELVAVCSDDDWKQSESGTGCLDKDFKQSELVNGCPDKDFKQSELANGHSDKDLKQSDFEAASSLLRDWKQGGLETAHHRDNENCHDIESESESRNAIPDKMAIGSDFENSLAEREIKVVLAKKEVLMNDDSASIAVPSSCAFDGEIEQQFDLTNYHYHSDIQWNEDLFDVEAFDNSINCVSSIPSGSVADGLPAIYLDSSDVETCQRDQDVVPHDLLGHYCSMVEPYRAETVESEIAKYCAYSLPSVAYTLGRENWHCLRDVYDTLASDMQWKVRRSLAFSIHELAQILGVDRTSKYLIPVFNSFLVDLDEVRIGVLKHFADFIKVLKPEERTDYLRKLSEFLTTENSRNWRFRRELAGQLSLLCETYTASEVYKYITPLALTLTSDQISKVRQKSFKLIGVVLKALNQSTDPILAKKLMEDLHLRHAISSTWVGRQTYAILCQHLLDQKSSTQDQFSHHLLPDLLELSQDKVPNVRLAVSRTINFSIINSDTYMTLLEADLHDQLLDTISALNSDDDQDVRNLISMSVSSGNTNASTGYVSS